MNDGLWRALWVVAAVAVAGCVGTGGSMTTVTEPETVSTGSEDVQRVEPAAPEESVADEEPLVNTLKWSTASEVDNFGFDIYRSTSEDGQFDRITSQPIVGAGTVDEPRYYEFIDDTIEPGVEYYYYIESISFDGIRERFSPIIRSPAKRAGEAGASEEGP